MLGILGEAASITSGTFRDPYSLPEFALESSNFCLFVSRRLVKSKLSLLQLFKCQVSNSQSNLSDYTTIVHEISIYILFLAILSVK